MSQEQLTNPAIEQNITALQQAGVLDAQGRAHDTQGHFVTAEEQNEIISHGDQILSGLNSEGVRHPGEVAREKAEEQRQLARNEALHRFNEADKNGLVPEHAAGPDYRKATGLSHEDVQRLGFKSFSELATTARERRAQEEKLEAEQRAHDEYRAKAEDAAAAWRKDADALRDSRSPHTAELRDKLEGATYKERLEMGGQLGIQRAKKAAEIADAKHQAGQKRHVHVSEPSEAAKKSQAETVAALRAHARGLRPGEELTRVDDKDTAYDEAAAIAASHVPSDEFTKVHEAARWSNMNRRERARAKFARAVVSAHLALTSKEYRQNIGRRRKAAGAVMGVVAVAAVGVGFYLAAKNGHGISEAASLTASPSKGGGSGVGQAAAEIARKAAEAAGSDAAGEVARKTAEVAAKAQRVQELGVVNVPKGGTYIDTIGQWTAARGVKMSGAQSTEMYHHLVQLFPDGNFFTEAGESYSMGVGEFGINKSGTYHVRPEVMAAIAQKAQEMGLDAEDILTKLK